MATSKLHDLFDRMGMSRYATVVADVAERSPGIDITRVAQRDPLRPPFHESGPGGKNIFEGARLTKMHEKHQGVPPGLQDMVTVEQKKGPVQQLAPLPKSRYIVDPASGGEAGMNLPSGGRMIGLDIPRTEEGKGPYSEDPSGWRPEVIGPEGGFHEGWDEPTDMEAITQEYNNWYPFS